MNQIKNQNLPIILIGAGNIATHIGMSLYNNGLKFNFVWSRKIKNAELLANKLKTNYTNDLSKISQKKAVYLICVPDNAISKIAKNICYKNSVLIHTSASTNISVLKKYSKSCGVFYPLQTFKINSKSVNFNNLPIFIEYTDNQTNNILKNWIKLLNGKLIFADSEKRLLVHIAAIFANNFTNHMIAISHEIAEINNIDFDLFKPLIIETFNKITKMSPLEIQTGPAIRNDKNTIKKHLKALEKHKDFAKIYSFVSKNIHNMQSK